MLKNLLRVGMLFKGSGVILLYCLSPVILFAQEQKKSILKSKNTGDHYEIIIQFPKSFDSTKSYNLVFFPDATINSGNTILSQDKSLLQNCVLVGIGHQGDWSMKRQRDFIPSDAGGYSNEKFGQAGKFYLLMKNELLPYIQSRFPNPKKKVFIGHSFGGLISLYMSMRDNKLFDHYYAISPSIWANYNELLKIEENYSKKNKNYQSNISMYAGSLEVFNKVLSSSSEFYETVKKRNYKGININYKVVNGANHYGIMPKIIPEILKSL